MSQWKPALAVLLVFIAGLVVGVVGTRMVTQRVVRQMIQNPAVAQDLLRQRLEMQLARRLGLGPVQRKQVAEILADMQQQLRIIQQETQPRRAQVLSNASVQIHAILSPEQWQQFQRMREENQQLPLPPLPARGRE